MKKHEYDAVLEEWSVHRSGTSTILRGAIKDDDKGRFMNGDLVRTSAVLEGWYNEGNIIQTRNTRYLLGKRAGVAFDDGHQVQNTALEQIASLRGYMNARGYNMVYTDSSVFFRLKDPKARTGNNQVSFRTAVEWHNRAAPFMTNEGKYVACYVDRADQMIAFRTVKNVKLQVTGNRIIVQSHKIEYVKAKAEPVDVHALLESL